MLDTEIIAHSFSIFLQTPRKQVFRVIFVLFSFFFFFLHFCLVCMYLEIKSNLDSQNDQLIAE